MRDLLFKNLTSNEKKRKIIASCEVQDKEGIRSVIRRHFICVAKEVANCDAERPKPYVYVLKETKTKQHTQKFFCKIKGSIYAIANKKVFLLYFMHTLNINLTTIPNYNVLQNTEGDFSP